MQQIREFQTFENNNNPLNETQRGRNTSHSRSHNRGSSHNRTNNNTILNNTSHNNTKNINNTTHHQYYDPERDILQFKEIEELELDAEFMSCFLIYFEDYFKKAKKVKLSLQSIDNLYSFLK